MKSYLNVFLIIFLFFSCEEAQTSDQNNSAEAKAETLTPSTGTKRNPAPKTFDVSTPKGIEEAVTDIRKSFVKIESLEKEKQLQIKKLDFSCPDDPQDGSLSFYFHGDTLMKAVQSFVMGDHYGGTYAYYFNNDELIFGYHQSSVWTFAEPREDGTPTTKDDINVQRDYFYKGKLIKQLFKDYTFYSDKESIKESDIPNKKTGKGVSNTLKGEKLLEFSKLEKLTCEIMSES